MSLLVPNRYKGKLIVVEGIDGSGKSTQLSLLSQWLRSQGYAVAFSEWNSSPLVKQTTRRGKKKEMFTPTTFSLIHATDFADRLEGYIQPLLQAGAIVCADRYAYTAFARDVVRGVSSSWVRNLYRFAIKPNLAFYFRVPLDVALGRILGGRDALKHYEAGMDLDLSRNIEESFRIFQGRILKEYDAMAEEMGFHVIDATRSIERQQREMRRILLAELGDSLREGVLEGPDSVGRSTQVARLRGWLEQHGHAVLDTGMARSALAGKGIQEAKKGNTLGPITMTLYYTTDFADRLENEIIPALRAGFVVLTDRYIFSIMARAIARGEDRAWIEKVIGFALVPHKVFYMRAGVKDLVSRVVLGRGRFDYWESGMDLRFGKNMFDSFVKYQTRLVHVFDRLARTYDIELIDASRSADEIFHELQTSISRLFTPRQKLRRVASGN